MTPPGERPPSMMWSDDFDVVDASTSVTAFLVWLAANTRYYVVIRGANGHLYVFTAAELSQHPRLDYWRRGEAPPDATCWDIFDAIDVNDASLVVEPAAAPADLRPLPQGRRPLSSRFRFVQTDVAHALMRVGEDESRTTLGELRPPSAPPTAVVTAPPVPAPSRAMPPAPPLAPIPAPPAPPPGPGENDEGTEPVRHPALSVDRELQPGRAITLTVDLLRTPDDAETRSTGVRLAGLPADWTAMDVDVEVACNDIEFGTTTGRVVVQRNAASIPAAFTGVVRAGLAPGAAVHVIAVFTFGGRDCGLARRQFTVGANDAPAAGSTVASPVVLERAAAAPTLTVRILRVDVSRAGLTTWSLSGVDRDAIPGLPARLSALHDIGPSAESWVRGCYESFEREAAGSHVTNFNRLGIELWSKTPPVFQQTYWAVRDALGPAFPIQIITDEPYMPWELMLPWRDDPSTDTELLALTHPVARWVADYEGSLRQRLPAGRVVTITPHYAGRDRLPWAEAEGQRLQDRFGALASGGTREALTGLLQNGWPMESVALLHFAGHGEFESGVAERSRIRLEGGTSLESSDIKLLKHPALGAQGPLVILNACDVGATAQSLGAPSGWAPALLGKGFRGFVAPLWPVYDEDATQVIEELCDALLNRHETVGDAMLRIRAAHASRSPTFLAYLYYGDVMARFPVSAARSAGST